MSDITVNDRRLFTKDGEVKKTEERPEERPREERPEERPREGRPDGAAGGQSPSADEVDLNALTPTFSTLIIGLATAVLVHLGETVAQEGDAPRVDLAQAKNTIDMLAVLERKTRGNLDDPEDQLLKTLLYELRIKYVTALKK
jgi:hypothetical protein